MTNKNEDTMTTDQEDTMIEKPDDTTGKVSPESGKNPEGEISNPTPDTDDTETTGNPNKEAAKYRRQLRDVEAERDALTGQVEAMQRAMIESEVARAGYKPAAFWSRDENTADQFFTDDGTLDTDALSEAITTTARELGLTNGRGPVAPREGGTSRPRATKSWDSAFRAQNG